MQIFVSYAREDAAIVRQLRHVLDHCTLAGAVTEDWPMAATGPRPASLSPYDQYSNFISHIERLVSEACLVVVLIPPTRHWAAEARRQPTWTQRQLDQARGAASRWLAAAGGWPLPDAGDHPGLQPVPLAPRLALADHDGSGGMSYDVITAWHDRPDRPKHARWMAMPLPAARMLHFKSAGSEESIHAICSTETKLNAPILAMSSFSTCSTEVRSHGFKDLSNGESLVSLQQVEVISAVAHIKPGAGPMPRRKSFHRGAIHGSRIFEDPALTHKLTDGLEQKQTLRALPDCTVAPSLPPLAEGITAYVAPAVCEPQPGQLEPRPRPTTATYTPPSNGNATGGGSDMNSMAPRDTSDMTLLELYFGPLQPSPAARRSLADNIADLARERAGLPSEASDTTPSADGSIHGLYRGSKLVH